MFMLLDTPEIVFLLQQNFAAPVVAEFLFSLLFESGEFDSVLRPIPPCCGDCMKKSSIESWAFIVCACTNFEGKIE